MSAITVDLFVFANLSHHAAYHFPRALRPLSVIVGTPESLYRGHQLNGRRVRHVFYFVSAPWSDQQRMHRAHLDEVINHRLIEAGDVFHLDDWPELRECANVAEARALLDRGYCLP